MRSLSSTADGKAPRIEFRVAAELHERVIKTAGSERGALSEFVRQAVTDAIERAEQEGRAPPDLHGLAQHGTTSDPDPARGLDLFSLGGPHGSQDPESDQPGAARRPADTPIINPPRRLTRKAEA